MDIPLENKYIFPNFFIRLTIQHKYLPELKKFLLKDITQDSIYFLGLHKSNYEHFHLLAHYPNSIEELKNRFSQSSFRDFFGLKGLRNKINIKEHDKEDTFKTIHYVIDGCENSGLKWDTNIEASMIEAIKELDFPNKYLKKDNDKITIRTLIRTLINKLSNETLHQMHSNFNEDELLRMIIDKTIQQMIEHNISTKYQPLSEIILYEIVRDLRLRNIDKCNSDVRNSILLYKGFFENKLIKKISNIIL